MFHDIQALLDMLQRSRNSHYQFCSLILVIKGVYNSFELVPLSKRFTYNYKAETFMPQ